MKSQMSSNKVANELQMNCKQVANESQISHKSIAIESQMNCKRVAYELQMSRKTHRLSCGGKYHISNHVRKARQQSSK